MLSDRIQLTGGKAAGFDYMRLLLALLVICFHSVVTGYGPAEQARFNETNLGRLFNLILPMFFSLSGFLVAGSLQRSKSLVTFLGLRAFRIYPALAVDAVFCALVLGPLLTTLALADYVRHPVFHQYFQNILGIIHYELPGTFASNPSHEVNGQLWTIPWELECYIVLAALAVFGLHRRRGLFLLLVGSAMLAQEAGTLFFDKQPWTGRLLLYYFLAGVSVYLYRDKIRWNPLLFAACAALSAVFFTHESLLYVAPFPIAYVTIYLGLFNPSKIGLLESGDYSYGLFLYGYPVQQALVATLPFAREWYVNILLAIPITFAFAWMSWHLIEKRVLERKTILFRLQEHLPPNPFARLLLGKPPTQSS